VVTLFVVSTTKRTVHTVRMDSFRSNGVARSKLKLYLISNTYFEIFKAQMNLA